MAHLPLFVITYTHSLPIRNGVKSWWVRFLYFPDFWMVFVSYFPNFLWSPFLIFFIYFFEKHKFIFIKKNLDIFTHYSIAIVWFECIFFELSAFWHLFGYFSSKAIHFLVVNKKTFLILKNSMGCCFLWLKNLMGHFL